MVLGLVFARKILENVRTKNIWRVAVYSSEAVAAILLSIVGSFFDIFKKSTYVPTATYQPDRHVIFWACVWSAIAAYAVLVKICNISVKEGEDLKSKKLAVDLAEAETRSKSLMHQRDLLSSVTSYARSVVEKKTQRLAKKLGENPIRSDEIVTVLNPEIQIHALLRVAHDFYRRRNDDSGRLRLGLWMREPDSTPPRLFPEFSWDGEKSDCFTRKSAQRMELAPATGTISEIVKCYHSEHGSVRIISDCSKAAAKKAFSPFYPEQLERVKSIALYKHVFQASGSGIAAVLMLVSDRADHFKDDEEEEIRQFLQEILTRIEMEWMLLDIIRNSNPVPKAA